MGFFALLIMLVNVALMIYAIILATRFVEAVERIANRQAFSPERALLERLVTATESFVQKSNEHR